jgi:hypothetical protein
MKLPNPWVLGGLLLLSMGAITTMVGVFEGSLAGSIAAIGVTMPSLLSLVLGVILIRVGTRPGRFARRRR